MKPETFEIIFNMIDNDSRDMAHDILRSEGCLEEYLAHLEDSYRSLVKLYDDVTRY